MSYHGITEEICRVAWQMVEPSIARAAAMEVTNRWAGTIVVLSPVDGSVLFETRVNEDDPKKELYDDIAHQKASDCWEHKMDGRYLQRYAPLLYRPGNTKWAGGIYRNGMALAYSGVQQDFDEMISGWMHEAILALCRYEMVRPGGVMDSPSAFL